MENEKLQEQTESMADYEAHFDDANPWNVVARYQEEGTNLHVKVEGIVNGGVIAMVEGLRGFIPASRLSLSYIEDLETYLLKEIDVRVIEANQAEGRLILSAREILREQKKAEDAKKLASVQVGSVVKVPLNRFSPTVLLYVSRTVFPVWFTFPRSVPRESNQQIRYFTLGTK